MDGDDAILAAPPSAKLVYLVLDEQSPLTQQALAGETLLPPRTVRSALSRLDDLGLVETRFHWQDARKRRYTLAEP